QNKKTTGLQFIASSTPENLFANFGTLWHLCWGSRILLAQTETYQRDVSSYSVGTLRWLRLGRLRAQIERKAISTNRSLVLDELVFGVVPEQRQVSVRK